jgi:hypothetical protein
MPTNDEIVAAWPDRQRLIASHEAKKQQIARLRRSIEAEETLVNVLRAQFVQVIDGVAIRNLGGYLDYHTVGHDIYRTASVYELAGSPGEYNVTLHDRKGSCTGQERWYGGKAFWLRTDRETAKKAALDFVVHNIVPKES